MKPFRLFWWWFTKPTGAYLGIPEYVNAHQARRP